MFRVLAQGMGVNMYGVVVVLESGVQTVQLSVALRVSLQGHQWSGWFPGNIVVLDLLSVLIFNPSPSFDGAG